jgi:acyl-CoA synthetase (AMP-forming)/AMP-acid ligase II
MTRFADLYTLPDLLTRAAARFPDSEAIVFPSRRLTYAQLDARATEVARSLYAMGIRKGDHVGILMANSLEYVELLLGIGLLGAWVVPINSRYKARELGYVVENADLRLLFTTDAIDEHVDFVELLSEALPGLSEAADAEALSLQAAPLLKSVVLIGTKTPAGMVSQARFQSLAAATPREVVETTRSRVAIRDVALMLYTSGTTAMPKGCPLSHEALVRTALEAGRTRFRLVPEDRMWDPLPMFHMSFVFPLLAVMDAGASLLSMERFEPAEALKYMESEQVSVSFATFPTITQALLSHPEYDPTKLQFRLVNNVAPPDTLRAMQSAMPFAVQISAYGLTEAGGVTALGSPDDSLELRTTTSGRAFRGVEVEIRDLESGEPLPTGERGEICIRGYCLFEGYYKDPEKTAATIEPDGWFHTGDIGCLNAEGYISYVGRSKDMLKVGGENVAAAEIESYLGTHPAVLIAQVVGIPDAKYDEVPAAFVELRPGAVTSEQELIDFCRGEISSFKVPRHVRFVDEWPMSATKIQKFRLRERMRAELDES